MKLKYLIEILGQYDPNNEVVILPHSAEHPQDIQTVVSLVAGSPNFNGRVVSMSDDLIVLSPEKHRDQKGR